MTEKCPMCAQEVEIISDPEGTTFYKGLERAAAVAEFKKRIGQEFARRIRWAQETTEGHIARGDREATQLSRERGRVYRLALEIIDPDHEIVVPLAALDSDSEGEPDA